MIPQKYKNVTVEIYNEFKMRLDKIETEENMLKHQFISNLAHFLFNSGALFYRLCSKVGSPIQL